LSIFLKRARHFARDGCTRRRCKTLGTQTHDVFIVKIGIPVKNIQRRERWPKRGL